MPTSEMNEIPGYVNLTSNSPCFFFVKKGKENLVQCLLQKVEEVHCKEQHIVKIFSMSNKQTKNWRGPSTFNLKILLHRCRVFDELIPNEDPVL